MSDQQSIRTCADCIFCTYHNKREYICEQCGLVVIVNDVPSEHHFICRRDPKLYMPNARATQGNDTRVAVVQCSRVTGRAIKMWPSAAAAARTLDVSLQGICNCLHGKTASSAGYMWRYLFESEVIE